MSPKKEKKKGSKTSKTPLKKIKAVVAKPKKKVVLAKKATLKSPKIAKATLKVKVPAKASVKLTSKTSSKKIAKAKTPVKVAPKTKTLIQAKATSKVPIISKSEKKIVQAKVVPTKAIKPLSAEEKKKLLKTQAKSKEQITPLGPGKETERKPKSDNPPLAEEYDLTDAWKLIKEPEFFQRGRTDECLEKGCENLAATAGFCRYHYIRNWKDIKVRLMLLKEGRLQQFIEEIVKKYPVEYIQSIMADLASDKDFYQALKELNVDTADEEFGEVNIDELDDDEDEILLGSKGITPGRTGFDDETL